MEPRPTTRRTRLRRLTTVVVLLGVLAVAAAACVNLSITSRMGRIDGAFEGLADRPPEAAGETILMVGTRPGGPHDVPWLPGEQSVESVMLVELYADGRSALVESVPESVPVRTATGLPGSGRAPWSARSSRRPAAASTT